MNITRPGYGIQYIGAPVRRIGSRIGPMILTKPYILRDEFTSGTLASPRTCTPGPGTVVIVDTGNKYSLVGEQLTQQTTTDYLTNPRMYASTPFTRTPGLTVATYMDGDTTSFGWTQANTSMYAKYEQILNRTSFSTVIGNGSDISIHACVYGQHTKFATILRAAGAFYLAYNNVHAVWQLLYVSDIPSTATVYAMHCNPWNPNSILDNFTVAQMTTWATDSFREYLSATPVSGDIYSAVTPNNLTYVTWTPQAAETLEIMIRRTDDNNCWIFRCSQGGSTAKMISKAGGVETERSSQAYTFTVGTPYRIGVTVTTKAQNQSPINGYINDQVTVGYFLSTVLPETPTGIKIAGGASLSNWEVFPYEVPAGAYKDELDWLNL